MSDPSELPDWDALRTAFLGISESLSVKSYYPQLKERLRELEENRSFLEAKTAALARSLTELEAERRKARENGARLEAVFGSLPFALWAADGSGVVRVANELAKSRYGMAGGLRLSELPLPEPVRRDLADDFREGLAGGFESYERPLRDGAGIAWIRRVVAPVVLDGRAEGVLGADMDITDLKRAEESLSRLNEGLESKVAERTSELEKAIEDLKAAQDRIVLSEKLAAIGRLAAGMAHDLNSPLGALESSIGSISDIVRSSCSDLISFSASLDPASAAAFARLASKAVAGAAELDRLPDRRERRAAAAALRESGIGDADADFLAEAGAETGCGEEILGVARELGAASAIALVRRASAMAAVVKSSAVALQAARRIALVVRTLKSFDDQEPPSALPASPAACDLDASLESALELFRGKLRDDVELRLDLACGLEANADAPSLVQVWINLLNNALQAMGYRGLLEVSSRAESGECLVEVADSGCGIDPEIAPRVFEPFFTTKPLGEGNGFGLVAARRIVERAGGSISFESRPGRTVFRVRLPAAAP